MIGSTWGIWDLHVHTPASLTQNYGSDEAAWESFLSDIEDLPSEFRVLGVNDYIFIDGYRRLLHEKETNGRLANIDTLLPVVELRLDQFGGTEGNLSRLNFHVIFSERLSPDTIEQQFLAALYSKHDLDPASKGHDFSGAITYDTLRDLGQKIIASVPDERKGDFGSPLIEGFNNINFPYNKVIELLESNSYLKGKHLTAIGKTEWQDIKWTHQSIANK
jgi:hypothetical protein